MKLASMKPGIWYEVTAVRSPGSFRKGDHIKLEPSGDILCKQAQGWIEAEHAAEELAKVDACIEKSSLVRESAALEKRLSKINDALK